MEKKSVQNVWAMNAPIGMSIDKVDASTQADAPKGIIQNDKNY